jgi:dihydroorotate dehydrogenase (fumarate)
MDLSTTYMGLKLKNPVIASSSKLTSQIDLIKMCAEAGAGAIVLKSLFEEQLLADKDLLMYQDQKYFWFPEAVEYIDKHSKEGGVKEYLQLIENSKKMTDVPIIASVNCTTPKEWPQFVKTLENSGADGIELNISIFPKDENMKASDIEDTYVAIIEEVRKYIHIPVAVKLGPLMTNPQRTVMRMCKAGMDAVVLFNRFFRPDIDIESEKVVRDNILSGPEEMTQSLRWVSLLSNRVACDIAANTGIHNAEGAIKQLLAGATTLQVCSTLYNNGIEYIEKIVEGIESWMQGKGYETLSEFRGKISRDTENVAAFERVQFMKKTLGSLV